MRKKGKEKMGNSLKTFFRNPLDFWERVKKKKQRRSVNELHVLVIHYDDGYYNNVGGEGGSCSSFVQYLKEREISIEDYICSFFITGVNLSFRIHHVVSLSTPTSFFHFSSSFAPYVKNPDLHSYQYFTFSENDETEEFSSSNVKRFSLILIPSIPPPFLIQNLFTAKSLETVLKDKGAIVASGFSTTTAPYKIGKRIVIMDYPSSVYSNSFFQRFFKWTVHANDDKNDILFLKREID